VAHFAKVTSSNVVIDIIVVSNDDVDNLPFPESEPVGQTFIASLGIDGNWLQTSYNGNFRNIYAGPGILFDATLGEYGEFYAPLPVE
jgi:hypothetical protein